VCRVVNEGCDGIGEDGDCGVAVVEGAWRGGWWSGMVRGLEETEGEL